MKRVSTYALVPGMKVAEDVYNYNKQLVLPKGTILTDDVITRLEFYSVIQVYITDETSSDNAPELLDPDVPHPSFSERLQQSTQFIEFKKEYEDQVSDFRNTLNDVIRKNTDLNQDDLLHHIQNLVTGSPGPGGLFDMLHNMRQYNDATYTHCINVSLICNTFGKWLSLPDKDIDTVTLCGLLHDVGKLMVPLGILNKPSKLTESEFNIIKRHPINGYRVLKNLHIDPAVCNAALFHHEKCDGSGYPYGLTGERLDPFTKIVTIADIYEAMTCARIYRGALCPFRVIALFEEEGFQKYDTKYILTFLSHVAETYLSYRVRLSDGSFGEIVLINRHRLSRPLIKCGSEFIDLSKRRDLEIDCII